MIYIQAIPKSTFDKHFSNDAFSYYDYACFISILDCDNDELKYDTTLDNFLQVKMWDIEEDAIDRNGLKFEKPSDVELQKIVDFVNKHKDKVSCIIHCSAGISRSGAVASFMYDKFQSEVDKESFVKNNKQILPNLYIKKRLMLLDKKSLEK